MLPPSIPRQEVEIPTHKTGIGGGGLAHWMRVGGAVPSEREFPVGTETFGLIPIGPKNPQPKQDVQFGVF
jgi:hypothetical protein